MNNNTTTAAELLALVREQNSTLPEVMLRRERELNETPPELVYEKLRVAYGIMRQAVEDSLREPGRTMGGLIGGEAIKLQKHREAGKNLCGETVSRAICYAMGVLEVSASMGLIVAAPTAGASGVLPGVLIALQQQYDLPDEKMLDALLVASAVGVVVAENSGISGAAGGCQAEVGTASAMAAAAAVYLMDGSAEGFACACCLDHSSFLPSPELAREDYDSTLESCGSPASLLSLTLDGKPLEFGCAGPVPCFHDAIALASRYCYLRTGDLLAIELSPPRTLCSRDDGSVHIEGCFNKRKTIDFKLIF